MTNELTKDPIGPLDVAQALAGKSVTLTGLVRPNQWLPMGWMIDLPESVLMGNALPPAARELFWLLARCSFQMSAPAIESRALDGTVFRDFLQVVPTNTKEARRHWRLVRPAEGFDFLPSWFLDPAYVKLSSLALRLLSATSEAIANAPKDYLKWNLELEYLFAEHMERRQKEEAEQLVYLVEAGATKDMVKAYFPHTPTDGLRFRPGTIGAIDLGVNQFELYKSWSRICEEFPAERQRLISLHREFPKYSIAALFHTLHSEG